MPIMPTAEVLKNSIMGKGHMMIFPWTNIMTGRQTDTYSDRLRRTENHRQTDKQTGRQTDRQTDRQKNCYLFSGDIVGAL